MTLRIVNAAPMVRSLGIEDASTRVVPIDDIDYPQHLPIFYFRAARGTNKHTLADISLLNSIYGKSTFDPLSKYYNHATLGIATVVGEGNKVVTHRVTNSTHAKLILALDLLETELPVYQRDSYGDYVKDNNGSPLPSGATVMGYIGKWVLLADGANPNDELMDSGVPIVGQQPVTPGGMTNADGVRSKVYPMVEFLCDFAGSEGNNVGFRLFANAQNVDTDALRDQKAFAYRFQMIERSTNYHTPDLVRNIFGTLTSDVTFNPQSVDLSGQSTYVKHVINDRYSNTTDGRYEFTQPLMSKTHVYERSMEIVHNKLRKAEDRYMVQQANGTYDQHKEWESEDNKFTFNCVTGKNESNSPYHTFVIDETATPDSVRLTPYTNVYLRGAQDMDLSDEAYHAGVIRDVAGYNDPDHPYQELAVHVESALWDTGFPVSVKMNLIDFISQRHDTMLFLATHVNDNEEYTKALNLEQELSTAIALRTRLRLHPESEYFATPVTRAVIFGGSGRVRNAQYRNRATLAFDRMAKFARYMGASNYRWKAGEQFSHAPGSVVESMYDVNIPWIPASLRVRTWDVGLNLPLAYNTRDYFWPAVKTVYANDTSVLTSATTVMGCCTLEKIGHKAWREYSGVDYMTNAQLKDAIESYVLGEVFGIFDSRFVIIPKVWFTRNDVLRGYSWHLTIEIYAANMKTVETLSIKSFRLSDSPFSREAYQEAGVITI
jgi:hypothetical protein